MPGYVIGVSIAQTNNACVTSAEEGIEDYYTSFKKLNEAGVGDYYTINISCPNSFGGETFATPVLLPRLLERLKSVTCYKPVYIKMPINLLWQDFKVLLDIIAASPAQGVVIGNLNKDYSSLDYPSDAPKVFGGGLSGKPCFSPSNMLIRKTKEAFGNRFTIIGTGGIFSGRDALMKFEAGADLVQLITGMVFEGPGLPKEICRAYAKYAHTKAF
jgi:dihydroorotate dehydrogenase